MPVNDLIQLFSLTRPTVGPIVLDATMSEAHAVEIDMTESPIEQGGLVADHRVARPREIVLQGLVVAFPDSLLPPASFTRHISIWRRFRDIALRGDLLDVITTLEILPVMSLLGVRTVRTVDYTNALLVELRLRKVEFATIDAAQQVADAAQDLALGQAELGAQGTAAAAAAELAALGVL